jgi:hypothetical protein
MDPLLEAIAANNEGVQRLYDGKIDIAIATFQRATVTLKALSDRVAEWPQTSGGSPHAGFCFEQRSGGLLGLKDEHNYIYDRLLYIPPNPVIATEDDLEWIVLTASASIIYNLALSWHLQGRITGKAGPLKKAGRLYELVVTVLDNADCSDDSYGVLQVVSLNNLAHLNFELGDYDSCRKFLADMCDMLMVCDYLDNYLDFDEADEIRFNILHLRPPNVALAA